MNDRLTADQLRQVKAHAEKLRGLDWSMYELCSLLFKHGVP